MALAGAGNSTIVAYGFGLITQRAPDESRARVMSAVQAVMSAGTVLALAIGGAVVPLIGPRRSILAAGIASLLVIAVLAPALLRSSTQDQIPDVDLPPLITDFPLTETD
jgi:MFS family permease